MKKNKGDLIFKKNKKIKMNFIRTRVILWFLRKSIKEIFPGVDFHKDNKLKYTKKDILKINNRLINEMLKNFSYLNLKIKQMEEIIIKNTEILVKTNVIFFKINKKNIFSYDYLIMNENEFKTFFDFLNEILNRFKMSYSELNNDVPFLTIRIKKFFLKRFLLPYIKKIIYSVKEQSFNFLLTNLSKNDFFEKFLMK